MSAAFKHDVVTLQIVEANVSASQKRKGLWQIFRKSQSMNGTKRIAVH